MATSERRDIADSVDKVRPSPGSPSVAHANDITAASATIASNAGLGHHCLADLV
ncbi:MAG: hypothetical protein ACT4PZ_19140 [Panacagrimonas sp.]